MIDTRTAPYAALLLRVSLGILFLAHGLLLKVFTFTIPGTVGYFQSVGYPGFFAYLVIAGEIGGGLALLLGSGARVVVVAATADLARRDVAHVGSGRVLFHQEHGGWEYPAFWIIALIVQALLGDGAFALRVPRAGSFAGRLTDAHSH